MDPASWTSMLGISAVLFLAAAAFQAFIGVGSVVYVLAGGHGNALFFTERSDKGAFGDTPNAMVAREPGLDTYRRMFFCTIGGFLLAVAALESAVTWFGLRMNQTWAMGALTAAALVLAVFWVAIVAWYVRAGAQVSLGDIPPFMWVPGLVHAAAIGLGWAGLRPGAP